MTSFTYEYLWTYFLLFNKLKLGYGLHDVLRGREKVGFFSCTTRQQTVILRLHRSMKSLKITKNNITRGGRS